MKKGSIFSIDLAIVIATLVLMLVGILFILSSNTDADGHMRDDEFIKQIIWAIFGIPILFFFAFFNYQRLRDISLILYIVFILLLVITAVIGKKVNNARSWIGIGGFGIQASEFAKLSTILLLGEYLVRFKNRIHELLFFIAGFLICMLPMGLVLTQPDMGTALVFLPVFFVMTWIAGARRRHIFFIVISGFLMITISMIPEFQKFFLKTKLPVLNILTSFDYIFYVIGIISLIGALAFTGYYFLRDRIFYWICYASGVLFSSFLGSFFVRKVFSDYSTPKIRLIIFLDPTIDAKGSGWHIINSVLAVGSGGLFGKGFLEGTQSKLKYVPEQSTDFIFSIISEELGFLGGIIILSSFLVILLRSVRILTHTTDQYAHFIGAGIIGMLLYHLVINIGMTMGIMPITGIPLFFVSYGGSSLLTGLISIGIILNIYFRRYS
ncbi:MAG: rod shape-determining protein RodA [Spirochaetales bacterium]|nr:rod shape-determining protein RodA [Spirochaetales bacterium]